MPQFVKISGQWREVTVPRVKVSGQWRRVIKQWVKVSGTWRLVPNYNYLLTPAYWGNDIVGYLRDRVGSISPDTIEGRAIEGVYGDSYAGFYEGFIRLVGDVQIPGVTALRFFTDDGRSFYFGWNSSRSMYYLRQEDGAQDFVVYLSNNVDKMVTVKIVPA